MEYSATLVRAKEKTENTTIVRGSVDRQDADSPAYECSSWRAQMPDVRQARMVYGGTKAMRGAKENVLPMHPMEQKKQYEERIGIAVAYNAMRETVEGLVGMVFRKAPVYSEDMPEILAGDETQTGHLSDIDQQGNALPIFARTVAENAMIDGHTWLHIESPPPDPNVKSRAEERARPYWINVLKSQAHNYAYDMRDGRPVLTLFAYKETARESVGRFGEREVERIRVMREVGPKVVRGELWELRKAENEKEEWVQVEEYPIGAPTIPVVCIYANKTGTFESAPPLLDLTYEQIEHFRVRSERQKALTFAAVAVPWLFSDRVEDGNVPVKWGHGGMMLLNDKDAKTGVLESAGNGLTALKEELDGIMDKMSRPGLRMMRKVEGVQAQTATSEILQKAQGDASLVLFAALVEDGLNQALGIHAAYRSDIDVPGSIEINRDFHEKLLSPEHLRVLLEAADRGKLSTRTWLTALKDGEVLGDWFSVADEEEELEGQGASEIVRAIQQMRAQREAGGDEGGEGMEDAA